MANGLMTDLGTLPGGSLSKAEGINDKGQIVGYSEKTSGYTHAVLWQNGVMTDLGTLSGEPFSDAYGINDKEQIVGYCYDYQGMGMVQGFATLWEVNTSPVHPVRPIANFIGTPIKGKAPLTVQFTDKSKNNPTSWKWNFGDKKSSTDTNPSHTYKKAGKYTVSLTVKNNAGSSKITKSGFIIVK
jgi:probable HAF family extracellular repeat protein